MNLSDLRMKHVYYRGLADLVIFYHRKKCSPEPLVGGIVMCVTINQICYGVFDFKLHIKY